MSPEILFSQIDIYYLRIRIFRTASAELVPGVSGQEISPVSSASLESSSQQTAPYRMDVLLDREQTAGHKMVETPWSDSELLPWSPGMI